MADKRGYDESEDDSEDEVTLDEVTLLQA